ncbi:TetR/AcrR family transcriptional regulator [Bradyrhizobium sp. Arg314]
MPLPAIEIPQDGSRTDILSAAAQCFMDRGYTETAIDDVARRLGATKGRVYHHFASKADLFVAIFRTGLEMDYAAIAPHRQVPGQALTRLRAMAAAHCRQIIVSRPYQRVVWQGVQMLLRGTTNPELRNELGRLNDGRDAYERIFRDELERTRVEGALRFDNLGLAVSLMFVTLNSPVFWYAPRAGETEADIDRLVFQVVTHAMRGLGSTED